MNNNRLRFQTLNWLIAFSVALMTQVSVSAVSFKTDHLQVSVNDLGQVAAFVDLGSGKSYAATGQASPLLQLRIDGVFRRPDSMDWNESAGQMNLHYGSVKAVVQVGERSKYLSFELVSVDPLERADRIQWGPIATSINHTVGETIGVVRDEDFALGIQVLNVKTLGGPAENEEGRDVSRGKTAISMPWGSTLQAYSIDRSRPRYASVWGGHYPNMPIPVIEGETCIGSKIALFGCPVDEALTRIGEIGEEEGLPRQEFDGIWSRQSPLTGRSYLIVEFTESTLPEILEYAERGYFYSVYHGHPFKTWGHYQLRPDHFPNGVEGMKACVKAASAKGIRIGVHTLSNFINPNDPYISPKPDSRLAKTGTSPLVSAIDAEQTEIEVVSPEYFANTEANWLRTVQIGEELIRYGAVSPTAPWKLLNCQRGAWGTQASVHSSGSEVGKLLDHPYRVFFPNYEMQHEIAIRLADLFNATGIGHMDFDGHEGCWAAGQGTFGEEMFAKVFYDHLDHPVINGSSNVRPFHWRINTNANWGEPWYGGFRESMADYRFNNQALFDRNFMPNMMGWFLMTAETTLADIEWLMARNAGYDAGFALATSLDALRGNENRDELLDTIQAWEKLRLANVFSEEQKARLRDTANEFHLDRNGSEGITLWSYVKSDPYKHQKILKQPGEPTFAQWTYNSPLESQRLQFILKVEGAAGSGSNTGSGKIKDAWLELDDFLRVDLPVVLETGETLICDGTQQLRIYNAEGRLARTVELSAMPPIVSSGPHSITFDYQFEGAAAPTAVVRFKAVGEKQALSVQAEL